MEQIPSWETISFSACQQIPHIFLEPEGSLPRLQESATCPYSELYSRPEAIVTVS
jgi:hypothetical protein